MYRYSCLILLFIVILAGGCEKPAEPTLTNLELTRIPDSNDFLYVNSKEEPVLLVAGQEITSDDIINTPVRLKNSYKVPGELFAEVALSMNAQEFKETMRDSLFAILADRISDILLYNSAKKEIGDSLDEYLEKTIDSEIRKKVQQFGGDELKADEAIKETWYDRATYKKELQKEILIQWYLSTQKTEDSFIPYRRLIRKYDSMKDANFVIKPVIEFRSIDIIPSRLELPDPNMDRNKYAENFANELYGKLKSGEDFGELATTYSHGHRKSFAGLWEPLNPDSLAAPFDILAKTAMKMNPGEISEPIITDSYIFIIKLEKKVPAGYIPFEQVQNDVKKAVIKEQNDAKAMSQLDKSINQQMGRFETGIFVDYCLDKIHKKSTRDTK